MIVETLLKAFSEDIKQMVLLKEIIQHPMLYQDASSNHSFKCFLTILFLLS